MFVINWDWWSHQEHQNPDWMSHEWCAQQQQNGLSVSFCFIRNSHEGFFFFNFQLLITTFVSHRGWNNGNEVCGHEGLKSPTLKVQYIKFWMSHAANFWKNLLWALFITVYNPQSLTLTLLISYIYGAPILGVSRSHTTHHSR